MVIPAQPPDPGPGPARVLAAAAAGAAIVPGVLAAGGLVLYVVGTFRTAGQFYSAEVSVRSTLGLVPIEQHLGNGVAALADPGLLLWICGIGMGASLVAAVELSRPSPSIASSPPASGEGEHETAQARKAAATASRSKRLSLWRGRSGKFKAALIAVVVVACLAAGTLPPWSIVVLALALLALLAALGAVLVLVSRASPSRRRGAAIAALLVVAGLLGLPIAAFLLAYPPPCAELRLANYQILRGVHITNANGFHYVKTPNKPVRGIAADSIVRVRMVDVGFPKRLGVIEQVSGWRPLGIRAIGVTEDEDVDRPAFEDCVDEVDRGAAGERRGAAGKRRGAAGELGDLDRGDGQPQFGQHGGDGVHVGGELAV